MNVQVAVLLFAIVHGNLQGQEVPASEEQTLPNTDQGTESTNLEVPTTKEETLPNTDQGSENSEPNKPIDGLLISLDEPASFLEASISCEKKNLVLAYINNEAENEELTKQIGMATDIPNGEFWLGGAYMLLKEKFFWYSSEKLMTYNKWVNDTSPDGPACSMLDYTKGDTSSPWIKKDCLTKLPYICRSPIKKQSRYLANPEYRETINLPQFRAGFQQDIHSKLRRLAHGFFYGWF